MEFLFYFWGNFIGPSVIGSAVLNLGIGRYRMRSTKAGVCALLHVFLLLRFPARGGAKRRRGARLVAYATLVENQGEKVPARMKLGDVDQAWRRFLDNLPWPLGRDPFDPSGFATFQT